jgi:glycosyltransferase involved in cell wall biosynthesis
MRPSTLRRIAERLNRLLTTLDYYRQGIAFVRRRRPTLVHCNDYNTMWIGVGAHVLAGSAVVYDAHELWPDRNRRPEPRWLLLAAEALFVRVADAVITASPGYADVIGRRYRVPRPTVVRNVPRSADARPAGSTDSRASRTLVYAGGLMPGRGLEASIRAIADLPDVALELIGPGNPGYVANLRLLAVSSGVDGRVFFAAPVPPGELLGRLAGAGAGLALIEPVCLSYKLTLPNKLFEYLLAGLPVIATDLPVLGAFVRQHGVGEVTASLDPEAVREAVVRALEPERQRPTRERIAALAEITRWENEVRLLEAAYEKALTRRAQVPAR